MIPERHARYYAYVWPLFWPWLWLQLWRLERWQRQTGRNLLIAVERTGKVHVRCVADAPDKWRYVAPTVRPWEQPSLHTARPANILTAPAAMPAPSARAIPAQVHTRDTPLYLQFDTS